MAVTPAFPAMETAIGYLQMAGAVVSAFTINNSLFEGGNMDQGERLETGKDECTVVRHKVSLKSARAFKLATKAMINSAARVVIAVMLSCNVPVVVTVNRAVIEFVSNFAPRILAQLRPVCRDAARD